MSKGLNFYDRQHLQRLFVQEKQINALFNQLIASIAPEMRRWHDSGNKNSVWVRNSSTENRIDNQLIKFKSALVGLIQKNQSEAWKSANLKNDEIVELYIKGMALSSVAKEGMFSRNLEALKSLQSRVDNGMNLSQRVWNITKQTKGHVELFLESGIATGRSAEAIGRDFRQLLDKPDKRFRRIRNEDGKLVLSQPMKDYNPGRGIYRSSKMNALRVSATETNMAYRLSDSERWKQLDFVLGFEVKRSQNHKPCAICDALKGKYPKEFVFPGWHPFCICYAVPIVMNYDDFADYLLDDTISADKYVQDIPSVAKTFLDKNPRYLQNSYYGKLNDAFFSGDRGSLFINEKIKQVVKQTGGNLYVSFDPFSPIILQKLSELKTNKEKQRLLNEVVNDSDFKLLSKSEKTGAKTVIHPLHKGTSSKRWKETKQMAINLNDNGINVAFLPEYPEKTSADAITIFKSKLVISDFKYSSTTNWNTLSVDLIKGFSQSETIVLKLSKMDLGQFRQVIEYMKRNNSKIGNIQLINRYGKVKDIDRKEFESGKYIKKLRGFL